MKEVIPVRWLKTDSQTLNLLLILTTRFLLPSDTSVLHLHLSPCRHSLDSETPVHSLHTPDASQPSTLRPVHPLMPHHLLQSTSCGPPDATAFPPDPPAPFQTQAAKVPTSKFQGVVHGSPRILAAGLPFPGHSAPDPMYPSPTLNLVRVILGLGRNWHQRRWPWTLTILRNSSRPSGSPPSRPACLSTVSVSSSSMKEVIPVRWLKTDSQTLNLLLILTTRFLLLSDTSVLHLHLSPCRHSLDSETPVHSLHTPDASQPSTLRPVHPLLPHHLLQSTSCGPPDATAFHPDPPARSPPQRLSPLTFSPEFNKT
ncbi:hypothetical protein PAMA_012895 [Pampus argenteus]